MKKNPVILFLLLVFASMLISCKKEFEKLQVQIDDVMSTEINPIKKQIEEINGSIEDLEQTDKELKGYIETLEGTARQLQTDITANETKIDQTATAIRHELTVAQTSLEGNIALAKTEVVGQLTALRTEMQGKLDAVNATISELKAKDTALETQIANLRTYVDTQMALQTANTKEWANSTFSTLAQYQATTAEIAAIKNSITTLNASLADLETRLNTKIATDIASAVSTLEGELATTVTEITTAYTSAISTAKTELTTAYTGAIATAISNSETSMKNWVNTQLTGYYTIAKAETKLDSLHTVLNGQLTSQQEYLTAMIGSLEEQLTARIGEDEKKLDTLKTARAQLESALVTTNEAVAANTKSIDSLRTNLVKAKAELTEAYTSAINTAITTLDGKLTGDIATAVTTINTRIDQEVAALDAKITTLTSRVAACEDAITAIQTAIQTMWGDIATINQQIATIQGSISELQTTDAQLDGYIKTLQTTAANLQTALDATNEALNQAKEDLRTEISNEKAAVLAELASAKTAIEGQITQINTAIEALQAKDVALDKRIDTLSTYVNTLNQGTKDWASATFSTLEQYQATTEEITAIKTSITSLNASITELETRLNAKIGTDIAAAVSTLEGELATKVTELTTAYTNAISTAKGEITAAYTTAIANAISASETSMKGWVNEQLTGYYTIAQTEAKLTALQNTLTSQLNAQKTYFDELIAAKESDLNGKITASAAVLDSLNKVSAQSTQAIADNKAAIAELIQGLQDAKTELTSAYTTAIATAISTSEGKLEGELATQIAAVNTSIETKIAAVNTEITNLKTRVTSLETAVSSLNARLTDVEARLAELEKLLGQIQSVVVIPDYSDGSVGCSSGNTAFHFKVLPTGTAAQLAQAPLSAFKMEAVYTKTKALPTFVNIPVTSVSSIGDILKVTANVTDLKSEFFSGTQSANASLTINSGVSSYSTTYFPLCYDSSLEPVTIDLSATESANSYVVSSAGAYKFKGNVKGNSSTPLDGTPVQAELLWETFGTDVTPNVNDVIASVSYKDGYVEFETPATLKNGNAVIAVKDADDNILWSWHIWICKDFDPVATGQVYYNDAGTMMDRNLGATSATPGDVGALGLLYQWGRKDPFLSGGSISSDTKAKSTLSSWPSPVTSDSSYGTIEYAVKNPTTFITNNYYNCDWYYTGGSFTDNNRWQSTKTIYDPCPSGWRVPDGGGNGVWAKALGSSSSPTWDSINRGMNFSGKFGSNGNIWYPAAGCSFGQVGFISYWWSCTTNGDQAYGLGHDGHDGGTVYPSGLSIREFGFSVRCLKIVPVTGVSLSKESFALLKFDDVEYGEEATLTPIFTPASASNQNVTWSSSDPSVATVDQSGKVTAIKKGTATITVTTEEGGFSATCGVWVVNDNTIQPSEYHEIWATHFTAHAYPRNCDVSDVSFEYAVQGSDSWVRVPASLGQNAFFDAKFTGLTPETTYSYRLLVKGQVVGGDPAHFTTDHATNVPNASFEYTTDAGEYKEWYNASAPNTADRTAWWGSGNGSKVNVIAGSADMGYVICEPSSDHVDGSQSACLVSQWAVVKFAAGNLFTGYFGGLVGTKGGIVYYGRPFTARPSKLKVWLKYSTGNVNREDSYPSTGEYPTKGNPDWARVYVALGNWDYKKYSGTKDCPVKINTTDKSTFYNYKTMDGSIAYGDVILKGSNGGWKEYTINLDYSKTDVIPTHIIISCASSMLGDYFTGCDSSKLWIDKMELIYE